MIKKMQLNYKIKLNHVFSIFFVLLVLVSTFYLIDALSYYKLIDRPAVPFTLPSIGKDIEPYNYQICAPDSNLIYTNPVYDYTREDIQENIGYKNNKFGLYIYMEVDDFLDLAEDLVNSNGGEWGYVLVPYNVKDYRDDRWQRFFIRLNEKKLIPIIQLWDLSKENDLSQIKESAKFLDTLPWPTKNRYISVFNEVNDAKFWHNEINPEYYAYVLDNVISEYKQANENFFILNGAFNVSARTGGGYLDAEDFMIRMNNAKPGIFARLDGWATHPYPQPNFTGSPLSSGRDSIRAYEWELDILKNRFGVTNLPVFITETSWPHAEGKEKRTDYLPMEQVSNNLKYAFENVWLPDERVVAVTPFTIWYNPPFDHFSFVNEDYEPGDNFKTLQNIQKIQGNPPQLQAIWKCKGD